MKLRPLIICLPLTAMMLFSACGVTDDLRVFKDGQSATSDQLEQTPETQQGEVVIENELSTADTESVEQSSEEKNSTTEPKNAATSADSVQVVLYFANADKSSLEAETREIPKQEGIARATVNQLIAGPQSDALSPTLPAATILEDINIREGICTVDFSLELLDNISADAQDQLLTVYSIVNTLSQFDSVNYVQILVNGKSVGEGMGGVDISAALAPVSF